MFNLSEYNVKLFSSSPQLFLGEPQAIVLSQEKTQQIFDNIAENVEKTRED
jgi:hypothetical protein